MTPTQLNDAIVASTLINNWGGECINKTGEDIPYGVKPSDGDANIYGYDDGFDVSGYMYLDGIEGADIGYTKVYNVNVFQKKVEGTADDYQTAINLHKYLKQRKFNVDILLNKTVKCEHCYFATIVVRLRTFGDC